MAVYVGLDGGASKTAGAVLDDAGRVLARGRFPGAAVPPEEEPTDKACDVLREAAEALCRQAGLKLQAVTGVGIGLNGIDFDSMHERQHRGVAAKMNVAPAKLTLVNDGIVALWGATGSPAAALLQHGSAFTGAFRAAHGRETLFDNLGTGQTFDIRHEISVLLSRMLDGRVEPTGLLAGLLEHYGVSGEQFAEKLFRRQLPPDRVRSAPAVVYAAWRAGDAAAAGLVERAAADYALAARAMIARAGDGAADAVFGGGVIAQMPEEFWPLLTRRVHAHCPAATVKRPDLPPEFGAAVMAAFADGAQPRTFFAKVLDSVRAGDAA